MHWECYRVLDLPHLKLIWDRTKQGFQKFRHHLHASISTLSTLTFNAEVYSKPEEEEERY